MLHNLKPMSGPAKQYADHNIRFYQLFVLGETLGVYHALCATKWTAPGKSKSELVKYHNVLAPTIKDGRVGKIKSSLRVVEDQFMIPDGLEEDDDIYDSLSNFRHSLPRPTTFTGHQSKVQDKLLLSVDAHRLFKVSFLEEGFRGLQDPTSPEKRESMLEYCQTVRSRIEERKNHGFQGLVTL